MRSQWLIRDGESSDLPAMLTIYRPIVEETTISFELEAPSLDEYTGRFVRRPGSDPWLVLEVDGAIAGYAYASAFRGRAAYDTTRETTVYVAERYRRQGVATALMRRLLKELESRGAHRAVAGITLPNEASVALHESLGFRHVGTFDEVGRKFGRWHDVGFWELALDDPAG